MSDTPIINNYITTPALEVSSPILDRMDALCTDVRVVSTAIATLADKVSYFMDTMTQSAVVSGGTVLDRFPPPTGLSYEELRPYLHRMVRWLGAMHTKTPKDTWTMLHQFYERNTGYDINLNFVVAEPLLNKSEPSKLDMMFSLGRLRVLVDMSWKGFGNGSIPLETDYPAVPMSTTVDLTPIGEKAGTTFGGTRGNRPVGNRASKKARKPSERTAPNKMAKVVKDFLDKKQGKPNTDVFSADPIVANVKETQARLDEIKAAPQPARTVEPWTARL